MDVATRSADWLGEVVDLMREPSATVPVRAVVERLRGAFDVTMSGWHWFDPDGSFGMVMDPPETPANEPEMLELWQSGEVFDAHAVLQWFRLTGDLRPQTIERVPARVLPWRRRRPIERPLVGMGMEHQLSIVYRWSGAAQRAFVLARSRRDFSDDDLALAAVVQRSLAALDHQVTVVQRMAGARTGADLGLTGRELAVLQLIAEGDSTRRASRTLGCSPRTVEKHLENAYRRLGVRDRLNAVRVLWAAGVVGPASLPDHRSAEGPGAYRGLGRYATGMAPAGLGSA
jgi:DNA-binding CsgD family transcriptional regulator